MSVVSSDNAPEPLPSPLPLSSLFLTHWPALALCSCYPSHVPLSSVLVVIDVYVSSNKECFVTQPCVSVLDKREPQHYCDQHKQHYNTILSCAAQLWSLLRLPFRMCVLVQCYYC